MNPPLALSSASVVGRLHLTKEANSQDCCACWSGTSPTGSPVSVGVVADGCGSGAHSELGARALVTAITNRASHLLLHGHNASSIAASLVDKSVSVLRILARTLYPAETFGPRSDFIANHLLCTLLFFIDDGETLSITAYGDGVIQINDEIHVLDCDNTPGYLGYHLLSKAPEPTFSCVVQSRSIQRLVLATDGLPAELVPSIWTHKLRSLQRWLNQQAIKAPLYDDTSIVTRERIIDRNLQAVS